MRRLILCAVVVLLASCVHAEVIIETVPVGNPGNVGDVQSHGTFGSVDYDYNIGKYEVTTGEYTEFLNAVAADDTYGLYNSGMWSSGDGCKIQQSGSSGSFSYSVPRDRKDRPVNYVSWGDAARFANWLHNGQSTGVQDDSTTEDGAYFLDGATSGSALMAITRQSDATWVIPTENEWYKAAYHKNDGVTSNYFDYPTASDNIPSNDLINPDPGNNANFINGDYTIGDPYMTTITGAFENSESPYGTFDQGGNLGEWNETALGSSRGLRGGGWGNDSFYLHASGRYGYGFYPTGESRDVGFRVASVPEPYPGDANGDGSTDLSDFNIWNANKFTANTGWTAGDFNGDGTTDLSDFNIWNAHKFTVASGGAAPAPTEVPEPSTLLMLTIIGVAFGIGYWRRKRGAACGG